MKSYRKLFEELEAKANADGEQGLNVIVQNIDGTIELHGKKFENWEKCQDYIEEQGIRKYLKFEVVEPLKFRWKGKVNWWMIKSKDS